MKKEAKADAKADAALKKKLSSQVRICAQLPTLCQLYTFLAGNNQAHRANETKTCYYHSWPRGFLH